MLAIIVNIAGDEGALIKTMHRDRANAVAMLCQLHLTALYPRATARLTNGTDVWTIGMHPQKDEIIAKMRALEMPLPTGHYVLEGEYSVL